MKRLILAFAAVALLCSATQGEYEINTNKRFQQHEGWGVSLCWWANMCGQQDEAHLDSLIDWLVSPEGLNYNIFRYNIGGGDEPQWLYCSEHHMGKGKGLRAEMEGFQDYRGDRYHWDRDAAQIRVMRMIKAKRPDAIFEAFSNSAPYWMTKSGCVGGNVDPNDDNLNPDYYADFAHYLVDVCRHMKDAYGIEFRTLDPFNEPNTDYWNCSGSQEGCHFSTKSQIDFIRVLHPILKASRLRTVISASDETNVEKSIIAFNDYAKAGVLGLIGQFNTHTYKGNADEKAELCRLARENGLRLWQSETGSGGRGIEGNLRMAQRLIEDIRCLQPAAWVDWQYVEQRGDQWCLVTSADWKTYNRNRNYYVRQHFSRFIPAGYTFVDTTCPDALAAISPDGKRLVFVAVNNSADETTISVRIPDGFALAEKYQTIDETVLFSTFKANIADHQLSTSMPRQSISTFVFVR